MITRIRLEHFLRETYQYGNYEDYCLNGLQIEGKAEINKILLSVSLNRELIRRAVAEKADAIIVHHGFFGKEYFSLRDRKKSLVAPLIQEDISLFAIHLPMDGHPQLGHNALMFKELGAEIKLDFESGFIGKNIKKHSLSDTIDIFANMLKTSGETKEIDSHFNIRYEKGFTVLPYGPEIPNRIAIISGESAKVFETALTFGVDTFFCGGMKEGTPAIAEETGTNFVNLGHYYSEKPGVLALESLLKESFPVSTAFIDIPNPI